MRFFFIIGIVIWHVVSSEAVPVQNYRSGFFCPVTHGQNTMERNFFKHVTEENKGNIIFPSPSALMLLSMAAHNAAGETGQEMQKVLALPEKNSAAECRFPSLRSEHCKNAELHVASKIFLNGTIEPEAKFREMTLDKFNSEVSIVDFSDLDEATRIINEWAAAKTNDHIKDLMKPHRVNPSTTVVLASAVYFKGTWAKPLDVNHATRYPFQMYDGSQKMTKFMCRWGSYKFRYHNDINANVIEIPFKIAGINDGLSMFIVKPKKCDGLAELEKNMEKLTMDKLSSGVEEFIDLCLPQFEIESEINLNPVLQKVMKEVAKKSSDPMVHAMWLLGTIKAFFGMTAEYPGITAPQNANIVEAVQKVRIEFTEEDTKGSGSDEDEAPPSMAEHRVHWIDCPFLGFIASSGNSLVELFSFRYAGPGAGERENEENF